MTQTVWITRHGNRQDFFQPEWFNTAERPYDPPLAEDGIAQAKLLGKRLQSEQIHHIFCSPFLRTVQTAFEVAEILDLPIALESGLGEWLHPEWMPGMPVRMPLEQLMQLYPRIDPTYESLIQPTYPETEADVLKRTGKVSQTLSQRFPNQNLLLVSHGVAVQGAAWGLVSDFPPITAKFCCLIKVERSLQEWQLELDGDVSHLKVMNK
jgi:broad specificity phosphatase PhoE